MKASRKRNGAVAWMAAHPVAANLLMGALLIGGLLSAFRIKQEVFPEFSLDTIGISIPYPGASPSEVETGILLVTEDAVRGIDGVKKITSTASEGRGSISVELETSADIDRALQDVKNAVDRITTYPEDAERPTVAIRENKNKVLTISISGPYDELTLRSTAEKIRDELSTDPGITLTELGAARPLEISIEIPSHTLRSYGITPSDVAAKIRQSAVEIPAGSVRTDGGEVLIRTTERREFGREFEDIPILALPNGSTVLLGDIAEISDGAADIDLYSKVNGEPAITVDIYRVGMETPISVSTATQVYLQKLIPELPEGMTAEIIQDDSVVYRDRIDLLLRNAFLGLGLVLLMLGLFLEPRLAFWVTLGIPISILGSFLFLSSTEASINMISLFAFIVTLGIIVDDAVVVGENIYEKREQGMAPLDAAIAGAQEIAGPVTFAVLTNIVAFMPLLFVPGASGKLFLQIPAVAISVFLISLVESLFIMPAHLSHAPRLTLFWKLASIPSNYFSGLMLKFIDRVYSPAVKWATREHYITLSLGLGMLILCIATVVGGWIPFNFLPKIEADYVTVNARLPISSSFERTEALQQRLLTSLAVTIDEFGGMGSIKNIQSVAGGRIMSMGGPMSRSSRESSNLMGIRVELAPGSERTMTVSDFSRSWRQNTGELAGIENISFKSEIGRPSGAAIDVQLSHRNPDLLEAASTSLANSLGSFEGISGIDSGVSTGKAQLNFELTSEARSMGLTASGLARQTRSYLYGAEALRQQRGRDEIKVMVRLPKEERETLYTLENLLVRTPSGSEIPLEEAVDITEGRAYTSIRRSDGRRVNSVTAELDPTLISGNEMALSLEENVLPNLLLQYPGLSWTLEGEQSEQRDSLGDLAVGFGYALFVIYALLAIAFKSWVHPLIVMSAIPFGVIGAVVGHLLLGYSLSLISMFGIVALSGVVVNDSLVLLVTTNRYRKEHPHLTPREIVCMAGKRRFRPIILTSVTTFCGLLPMIFETSIQAKFLIPMAISIAFGILFATFIILLIVPAIYLVIEDLLRLKSWFTPPTPDESAGSA